MATLLFRLRHVPEDEADEVRDLLEENGIEFYETSAGNWRISMPAIWLTNDDQLPRARQLLDNYQQQRFHNARQEYESLRHNGGHRTIWNNFLENPIRFIVYLGLVIVVLYFSLQIFLSM